MINKNVKRMIDDIHRKDSIAFVSLYAALRDIINLPADSWRGSADLKRDLIYLMGTLKLSNKSCRRAINVIQQRHRLFFPNVHNNIIQLVNYAPQKKENNKCK